VKQIAAGLWHTLCITVNGQVYAFGGNQFGQLGTGNDQPEVSLICSFIGIILFLLEQC
jgi:alpha-tubulin suppressor-like RCC1 family protein